ncbi:hypothetical protein B0H63DRAFT_294174 [Podospora didyma]|uniref:Uncharacterized protein n=1 Tax=Podospora didyma TaxID=330526 RepID=A0AAE0N6Y2_9PEZI|nr:hypothetical protein B0H63DRAFT_294174 [Podospora didyma]
MLPTNVTAAKQPVTTIIFHLGHFGGTVVLLGLRLGRGGSLGFEAPAAAFAAALAAVLAAAGVGGGIVVVRRYVVVGC